MQKILQVMGIPDHLTCLLGNLYADQEATEPNKEQWAGSKLGKNSRLYIVTLLFNLYLEYIMRNAKLDEAQAGIKVAGRNINNLRMQKTPSLWQKVKRN